MVGQRCRITPSYVLGKEMVDNGEIGDLIFVESEYAHKYLNTFVGWRVSCHAVDLLRWFAGNPTQVMAFENRKVNDQWPYVDTK